MSQQQQQDDKPKECNTCRDKGNIPNQLITFEDIGENPASGKRMYRLLDHPSGNIHVHKKLCNNNCGTVIVYDTNEGRYRDATPERELHNCRNEPNKYKAIAEQHKVQYNLGELKQAVPQETKKEIPEGMQNRTITLKPDQTTDLKTNPIAEALTLKTNEIADAAKKIPLMWTMVKEDHERIEKILKSQQAVESMVKSFLDSYQKLEASIKTILEDPEKMFKRYKYTDDREQALDNSLDSESEAEELPPQEDNQPPNGSGEIVHDG